MPTIIPYARLSTFYFFYFAALGAFVPFWPVFLKSEIGFSAIHIGQLMAIFMVSKVIAPLVLGWLVDHYGKRLSVIRWASILTVICFSGIFIKQDFWWIALITFLFGFFWNASLPQFEALTLNHLQGNINKYSLVRLWGSIGFIVLVAGLPPILNIVSFDWYINIVLLLFIGITLSSYLVSDKNHASHEQEHGHIIHVLKHPIVIALLFACILQQGSHGVYYTF
ncbi:MAG TPA: MFS transporter, partial [Saprospiraceae bacterium]|nr:MFS transporter [Saprospiraceae bacterium]